VSQIYPANNNQTPLFLDAMTLPIRVGMVGTGFTAKLRAPTLQEDPRSQLVAVTGHTPEKTQEFSQIYQATAVNSWQELVDRDDVDLIMICTINRDHGPVARAALEAGKHVVVEYPLSLDPVEAETLLALADRQRRLLHIEHIELLGGVHNALKASLAEAGEVFYARYATISSKRPAPRSWTYHPDLFGFPFTGALSRLHRLTDVWGTVATVSAQSQFWPSPQPEYFTACLCTAQLRFTCGAIAELIYGKGERFWKNERKLEVYGDRGTLVFDGDRGQLFRDSDITEIPVGSRRGLFAQDTTMVLDHLIDGTPLYVSAIDSVYTLKIADAIRVAGETGQVVLISATE